MGIHSITGLLGTLPPKKITPNLKSLPAPGLKLDFDTAMNNAKGTHGIKPLAAVPTSGVAKFQVAPHGSHTASAKTTANTLSGTTLAKQNTTATIQFTHSSTNHAKTLGTMFKAGSPRKQFFPVPNIIPTLATPAPKTPAVIKPAATVTASPPALRPRPANAPVVHGSTVTVKSSSSTTAPAASMRGVKPGPNSASRAALTVGLQLAQDAMTGKVNNDEVSNLATAGVTGGVSGKVDRVVTASISKRLTDSTLSSATKASIASGGGVGFVTGSLTAAAKNGADVKSHKITAGKATADVVVSGTVGLVAGSTGAAVGAAVGSIVPGPGTVVGAVAGFAVGFGVNAVTTYAAEQSGATAVARKALGGVMEKTIEQPLQSLWKRGTEASESAGAAINGIKTMAEQQVEQARLSLVGH